MTNTELRDFLYREIPVSKFMQVEIPEASEAKVLIMAPLEPSRNHLDTAFGGSIGAVLILSCYAWLFHKLSDLGFDCHVLIKEGKTNYLHPVKEDLVATCLPPNKEEFEKFFKAFERKGLAKLSLNSFITTKEGKAAEFHGIFVAQKTKHD